jgi:hypothetical protein
LVYRGYSPGCAALRSPWFGLLAVALRKRRFDSILKFRERFIYPQGLSSCLNLRPQTRLGWIQSQFEGSLLSLLLEMPMDTAGVWERDPFSAINSPRVLHKRSTVRSTRLTSQISGISNSVSIMLDLGNRPLAKDFGENLTLRLADHFPCVLESSSSRCTPVPLPCNRHSAECLRKNRRLR